MTASGMFALCFGYIRNEGIQSHAIQSEDIFRRFSVKVETVSFDFARIILAPIVICVSYIIGSYYTRNYNIRML